MMSEWVLYIKPFDDACVLALKNAPRNVRVCDTALIPIAERPDWLTGVPTLVLFHENNTMSLFTGSKCLTRLGVSRKTRKTVHHMHSTSQNGDTKVDEKKEDVIFVDVSTLETVPRTNATKLRLKRVMTTLGILTPP